MNDNAQFEPVAAGDVNLGNTPETVIAFPYSDDYRVDVLLSSASNKWFPDLAAGQTRKVTYSFALSTGYLAGEDYAEESNGLTPFTATEKAATRAVFSYMSSILPITFMEVIETTSADSPVGDIRLVNNEQDSAGYALYPDNTDTKLRGDVFLANSAIKSSYATGTYEYDTIIHEISHALGLKHPGNYNAGSAPSTEPGNYLATSEDSKTLSVVSYAEQAQGLQRIDFAPYDLLALKYLYGLKAQKTDNSTYAWTDSIGAQLQTLIDDGGVDTIDLRSITTSNKIDLREGQSSSVGFTGSNASTPDVPALNNVQIAYGTLVESVIGSEQADQITGNAGNNAYEGRGGDDVLDGGEGLDRAIWSSPAAQYSLSATATGYAVQSLKSAEGTDQLTSIERLQFSDHSLALDLNGNAGITAKILGTVFGKSAVANQSFVGIGLHYLDDLSYSYTDLMQLAISARLGANPTSTQVVDLLYTNVVGTTPDAATRKSFTDLLDNGTFTVASLGVLAADTDLNKGNINLTGLVQTGLEYLPFAG